MSFEKKDNRIRYENLYTRIGMLINHIGHTSKQGGEALIIF